MLKDLIVNLSVGNQRDVAAEFAVSVAEKFEAHVTGMAYRFRIELPGTILGTGVSASIVEAQSAATDKQVAETIARFERAAKLAGVSFDTMSPDLTLAEHPKDLAAQRALTILRLCVSRGRINPVRKS